MLKLKKHNHIKSLLGMLDKQGRKQYYCYKCKKFYKEERRTLMKITKLQTALIVLVIGAVISLMAVMGFVKTHPILALTIVGGIVTTVVGYIMYRNNTQI
jgi:hypothetical protein